MNTANASEIINTYTLYTKTGERRIATGTTIENALDDKQSWGWLDFYMDGDDFSHVWCKELKTWIACEPKGYSEHRAFSKPEIDFLITANNNFFHYGINEHGKLYAERESLCNDLLDIFPNTTAIKTKIDGGNTLWFYTLN